MMVSQVQPQEETQESLRKTKLIIVIEPRERSLHARQAPKGSTMFWSGDRSKGKVEARAFIGVSAGKTRRAEKQVKVQFE